MNKNLIFHGFFIFHNFAKSNNELYYENNII